MYTLKVYNIYIIGENAWQFIIEVCANQKNQKNSEMKKKSQKQTHSHQSNFEKKGKEEDPRYRNSAGKENIRDDETRKKNFYLFA